MSVCKRARPSNRILAQLSLPQRFPNTRVCERVAEQRVLSPGERGTEAQPSKAGVFDILCLFL